jgi:cytochrome c-type biogenesis protein CcmE
MKKLHIVALVLIAFAIAGIAISASNYTSYEGFEKANANSGKVYKIVGFLDTTQVMDYDPIENPNLFTFYMLDQEGISQKVIYSDAKPQDFEKSEQLVVTGKSEGEVFYAEQILMKCPSKYVEDEIDYVDASKTDPETLEQ